MNELVLLLENSKYSFLLSNVIGLYIPFLTSLFLMVKYRSEVFNRTNIIIFGIGLTITFITASVYSSTQLDQLHLTNYFGITYLLYFMFKSKDKLMNLPTVYVFSFLNFWLVDCYFALFVFNTHPFSSAIGGAGVLDGLFIDPLFILIATYLLNKHRLKLMQST